MPMIIAPCSFVSRVPPAPSRGSSSTPDAHLPVYIFEIIICPQRCRDESRKSPSHFTLYTQYILYIIALRRRTLFLQIARLLSRFIKHLMRTIRLCVRVYTSIYYIRFFLLIISWLILRLFFFNWIYIVTLLRSAINAKSQVYTYNILICIWIKNHQEKNIYLK